MLQQAGSKEVLRCSFCHKAEGVVGKLVSSPSDYPRAYICDECIAVCNSILADRVDEAEAPVSAPAIPPPDASEYVPYFGRYISLVAGADILAALADQPAQTRRLVSRLDGDYRYAPGKWSPKEILGHLIDSERIFAYRALRIARNDPQPMEGFEQDDYVRNGNFGSYGLPELLDEFDCVRRATLFLFAPLAPDAWLRRGIANGNEISVRAIAYAIAGHELHHRRILEEKYRS